MNSWNSYQTLDRGGQAHHQAHDNHDIQEIPPARALMPGDRRPARRVREGIGVLGVGVLVAITCVVGLMGVSWIQAQGAVGVVRAQAAAIRVGDLDHAYAFFSSSYRSDMSLPMFRRWLRKQEPLARIHDLSIWGRSVWRGTAILRGSFEDDEGHSYPVRYSLVRENGTWRIDGLQVPSGVPESLPNDERFLYI